MSFAFNRLLCALLIGALLVCIAACRRADRAANIAAESTNLQTFTVTGVIKELRPNDRTIVIRHEAVTNYMPAMTMPFNVKSATNLVGLESGDEIFFQFHVTEDESWIDRIQRTGRRISLAVAPDSTSNAVTVASDHPLLNYTFTNEFGQPVRFNDFKGRAVAFTFFFTRCPVPEFCPRLSKNFVEAAQKLSARPNAPTNWHFLSITFDPQFDTPEVLRAYGQLYQYDSNHWSFLTGPKAKIDELAAASGVQYEPDAAFFNHNFRTLVLDAAGKMQMNFPISGDLSDYLVDEIIKGAAVTNR